MFAAGLVSVSFREERPESILREASAAGLSGIEWGGDVHVPPGDLDTARSVARLTAGAGLQVFAYGSYYRLGMSANPASDFLPVLDTRHWARPSSACGAGGRDRLPCPGRNSNRWPERCEFLPGWPPNGRLP